MPTEFLYTPEYRQALWAIMRDAKLDKAAKIAAVKIFIEEQEELDLIPCPHGHKYTADDAEIITQALQGSAVYHMKWTQAVFEAPLLPARLNILKENEHLEVLNLTHCFSEAKNFTLFIEALKTPHTFKRLSSLVLTNNQLGDEGIVALSRTLEAHRSLTQLNVARNTLTDIGMKALTQALSQNTAPALSRLTLSGNSIDTEGMQDLASLLTHNHTLTQLDLQQNKIGSETGFKALMDSVRDNDTLLSLNLDAYFKEYNKERDTAYLEMVLADNANLSSLTLSNNNLITRDFEAIARGLTHNRGLTSLSLDNNFARDEGAIFLATALESNTTLRTLNLRKNVLSEKAAKAFLKTLEKNTTLLSLELGDNLLGLHFETKLAIVQCLNRNRALATAQRKVQQSIPELFPGPREIGTIIHELASDDLHKFELEPLRLPINWQPTPYPNAQNNLGVSQQNANNLTATQNLSAENSFSSKAKAWLGSIWKTVVDFMAKLKDTILFNRPSSLETQRSVSDNELVNPPAATQTITPPAQTVPSSTPVVQTPSTPTASGLSDSTPETGTSSNKAADDAPKESGSKSPGNSA